LGRIFRAGHAKAMSRFDERSFDSSSLNSSKRESYNLRRESLKTIDRIHLSRGLTLEGEDLERYCRDQGLCPLCATTRVRRRAFKLFKKNRWESLTVKNEANDYVVYKGYCVKPNCFTLEQARSLAGEDTSSQSGSINMNSRSSVKGLVNYRNFLDDSERMDHTDAFPPNDLKNLKNFNMLENRPQLIIEKTLEGLKHDGSIINLDLSTVILRVVDLQALSSALKLSTTLSSLILENCELDDEKLMILGRGLFEAADIPLTKLFLRTNKFKEEGVYSLCPFLEQSTTLEKLDVSRNVISTMGAVAIFNAFHFNRLTRIRYLNLSHNELWDLDENNSGVRAFLSRNRTLKVLNLDANYIHDEVVESIAIGLSENNQTALERLYLGRNSVGDNGVIAFADILEANTSLKVLGLAENEITNIGARALLSAMNVNVTLCEISGLWRNQIDRRFLIVAIRRLLLARLSTDSLSTSVRENIMEQASQKMSDIAGVETQFSSSSSDSVDPLYSNTNDEKKSQDPVKQLSLVRANGEKQGYAVESGISLPILEPLAETSETPFDRLVLFQAGPLAYSDKNSGIPQSIPLQDFRHEAINLKESISQTLGEKIEVAVKIATVDRFTRFFTESESSVMHFSCYGHPGHLTLENGYGEKQPLSFERLKKLTAASGSKLRVAIISSRNARSIGQAFLDAGVPHVVCCQRAEGFRDPVADDFIHHLYQALAGNATLKQAFDMACSALSLSTLTKNLRMVLDRFHLLPKTPDKDTYHAVPVFFVCPVPPKAENDGVTRQRHLPNVPPIFLGRELVMHEILEALRVDDIIKVMGSPGNGKDSVVAAVCDYALERKKEFSLDDIFWLPAPEGVAPEEDTLYGDLCLCVNILKESKKDVWEKDEMLLQSLERINLELEDLRIVLVIDNRCFENHFAQENAEKFISHLINIANAKVIMITTRSSDGSSIHSAAIGSRIEEAQIDIEPLDFKSTAQLFGSVSKFISNSACPVAHTVTEFSTLCEPAFISEMPDTSVVVSQRRSDLFARMGSGLPSSVISSAKNMEKKKFIELIGIANRPEVFVDSLGALESEMKRRSLEKEEAVVQKNFMRAMDLDTILEDLEGMRSAFVSLKDLRKKEEVMKKELADAVSNRSYSKANDLKRELLVLKKKIMKEQRMSQEDNNRDATKKLKDFQEKVQSMIEDSTFSDINRKAQATFAVNCNNRDCSFVIYAGEVHDFQHPSEAKGIVCWSNESCELKADPDGVKLVKHGGAQVQRDIFSLPIVVTSKYGPVRCGTGNAVIIGPQKYGDIQAPCIILTVGPLCPGNTYDVELHQDTDSLHYIKVMLRSCYRSSLVLAKHAELQVLALSMLTTRKTGQAYQETLRVGLQTLVEEVKFSHLRDLHLVASSSKEASVLISMMSEMGHREI